MANLISIGQSALIAAQAGVSTTGNNIANVSTPGYSRQQVVQTVAKATPQTLTKGYLGQGTSVDSIRRVYSEQLGQQLVSSQAANGKLQTQYAQVQPLDRLLSDSATTGLGLAIDNFFNSLQDVAAAPSNVTSRQALLGSAQALSAGFSELDSQISGMRMGLNQQIVSSVDKANTAAQQIADLNQAIVSAGNSAGGPANDLLDRRDQLVRDLSHEVKVRVSEQGGEYRLFLGNGHPLVAGTRVYTINTSASTTDPARLEVSLGDSSAVLGADDLAGGALSGLLEFREKTLEPTQNALGRIALGLASGINAQNRAGFTLDNQPGGDFFNIPPMSAVASSTNLGDAQLSATLGDVSQLGTSGYLLQRVGDDYHLTRIEDKQVLMSSADLAEVLGASAAEGFNLEIPEGAMEPGDEFLIRPPIVERALGAFSVALDDPDAIAAAASPDAVGDNANILKMAELQSAKILEGGTRTYQSAYVELVGQVGGKARELAVTSTASALVQEQSERALQDVSGVNLDEEAANLIRYQQSFQAAGKVIQMSQQLFETVLSLGK